MNDQSYNYPTFSFALERGEYDLWKNSAPTLGAPAPDFELADIEGRTLRLRDLRGLPVVLEFGSYTCPIFCGHNEAMDRLAKHYPEASFLVVYTREAHPGERVGPHRDVDEKRNAVRNLLRNEPMTRAVLIDDVKGSVHRAYGGGWDTVFVISPDGRIVLRRAWNDPAQVEATLRTLREDGEVIPSESLDMAPPTGRPFGQGLLRGGERALLDFYDSAPPPVRMRLENSESTEVRAVLAKAKTSA